MDPRFLESGCRRVEYICHHAPRASGRGAVKPPRLHIHSFKQMERTRNYGKPRKYGCRVNFGPFKLELGSFRIRKTPHGLEFVRLKKRSRQTGAGGYDDDKRGNPRPTGGTDAEPRSRIPRPYIVEDRAPADYPWSEEGHTGQTNYTIESRSPTGRTASWIRGL